MDLTNLSGHENRTRDVFMYLYVLLKDNKLFSVKFFSHVLLIELLNYGCTYSL